MGIKLEELKVDKPNKGMEAIAIATFGLLMLIAGLLLGAWLE